jgi:hypothetical protein
MRNAARRLAVVSLLCSGLLGGCSVSTSGPVPLPVFSHIHNDTRDTSAHQAQDAMTEYAKNSPAMYAAMTANVELFRVDEDDTVSQFAAINSRQLVTVLPTLTNSEFDARAVDQQKVAKELEAGIVQQVSQQAANISGTTAQVGSLENALTIAEQKVTDAKRNVTAWNQQVAFFQLAFQSAPASNSKKSDALALLTNPETFKSTAEKAAATQFTYVDADGKTQPLTVGEFAQDKFQAIASDTAKGDISSAVVGAPGIALVIANLGEQLADLEQKKAQAELTEARQRLEFLEKTWTQWTVANVLLAEIEDKDSGYLYLGKNSNQLVVNAIEYELQAKNSTAISRRFNAAQKLVFLREEAVAESILWRLRTLVPLAIARTDHEYSITISSINDQEYQALIQNGLAGLVAYHDGGLTSQDVANLINFAQAIGVGVIAGRVY